MALTITDWLKLNKITASEFSSALGVSQSTMCKHVNAYNRLSPETAVAVEKLTGGRVSRLYAMWPDLLDPDWAAAYQKKTQRSQAKTKITCD